MHSSIRLETPCEFINVQPLNPLISKCQIKVCWVGEQANRNKSIITKEVATQMANSLPGSPIVGFYNNETGDFEEHNRTIDISNGKFEIKDATRPYGFVDLNAKCWFAVYKDEDGVEREYLCTEGWLWTGQYPEAQRIMSKGNHQSMELDKNSLNAHWTKDENQKPQFFIINEAIVSKLCILGEDCEPCFEGSNITKEVQFSLSDDFKTELFSMMNELKELLLQEKGGTQVFTTYAVKIGDSLWNALYEQTRDTYSIVGVFEDGEQKFAVLQAKDSDAYQALDFSIAEDGAVTFAEAVREIEYTPAEEPQFAAADVEAFEVEYKKAEDDKKKEEEEKNEGKDGETDKPESDNKSEGDDSSSNKDDDKEDPKDDEEDEEDKKKKAKYSLEEIPEYVELQTKFSELETKFAALEAEKKELESQLQPLQEFKAQSERAQKEEMIKSFYMLSDEDKKDVIDNIDTYSLDDIEAKLSIICVRNKVSFALDDDTNKDDPTVYNLGGNIEEDAATPAWIKAALETAKTLN